jgi:hypothetical protein
VWAEKNCVYVATDARKEPLELGVHPVQIFRGEKTAAESGLITRDGYKNAGLIQPSYGLQATFYRDPFISGPDVVVRIFVDHPVTIENDQSRQAAHGIIISRVCPGGLIDWPKQLEGNRGSSR